MDHCGKGLTRNTSHLVTIATSGGQDNGSTGHVEDVQHRLGMSMRVGFRETSMRRVRMGKEKD